MELMKVFTTRSPSSAGRVRLCGEVIYDHRTAVPEVYWFDVSDKYAEYLSQSGNPWLVCLLPLAVTLGEPLRLCAPVDTVLFENAHELMQVWQCWYPKLHLVPIEVEVRHTRKRMAPEKTAAFFSGGVDSFSTVLRHNNGSDAVRKVHIDDLLCVWGFDVPLENGDAFRRMRDTLSGVASDLGKELIDVATNLMETNWGRTDWAYLSHGAAFASLALVLEGRYSQVLLASSVGYRDLTPWGSHVVTDPLLSTGRTKIIHDGAIFSRLQKTELVAKSPVAMRSLRVCWRSRSDENCCACEKCYRTMLTLELLGALDRCTAFKRASVDVAAIQNIYVTSAVGTDYRDLQKLALQKGRQDIERGIDRAFTKSDRLSRYLGAIRALRSKRFVWRWAGPLERALLARHLT